MSKVNDGCNPDLPYYEVCHWNDDIMLRTNSIDEAKGFLAGSSYAVSIWGPFTGPFRDPY